jgi:hypothetical protein
VTVPSRVPPISTVWTGPGRGPWPPCSRSGSRPSAPAARPAGSQPSRHLLGVGADLGAEPAADVGGDDPHLDSSRPRRAQSASRTGGRPGAGVVHEAARRRPSRRRRTRTSMGSRATRWLRMRWLDHDLAVVEGRRELAGLRGPWPRWCRLGEQRVARQRVLGVDHGGERVVVDEDRARRRRRPGRGLGDDGGDRLADEADACRWRAPAGPSAR